MPRELTDADVEQEAAPRELQESDVDTGVRTLSDNDVDIEPVAVAAPASNVVSEDIRRVGSAIGKGADTLGNYFKQMTAAPVAPAQPQPVQEAPWFQNPLTGMQQRKEQLKGMGIEEKSPLEYAAEKAGGALNWLQGHVGKHIATGILKAQMTPDVARDPFTGQEIGAEEPKAFEKEFAERTKSAVDVASLKDVKPSKSTQASAKEMLLRDALSSLGGKEMQLNPEQAAPAEQALSGPMSAELPILGEVSAGKALRGVTEFAGELPFFVVGQTGTASRIMKKGVGAIEAGEVLAPAASLKAIAKLETKAAAAEMGVQGAILAGKSGEDVGLGAAAGYASGAILSKLGQFLSRNSAAKDITLEIANKGVVLPYETYDQFAREMAEIANKPTVSKHAFTKLPPRPDTSGEYKNVQETLRGQLFGAGPRVSNVRPLPKQTFGTPDADFTYATTSIDDTGRQWLQHIDVNAKTGAKIVHQRPLLDSDIDAMRSGEMAMPAKSDEISYQRLIDKVRPEAKMSMEGATGYSDREIARYAKEGEQIESAKTGPKTVAERLPIVASVEKNGRVRTTPVDDGALDDTLITPPRGQRGDMVRLPNGEMGIVKEERGPTLAVKMQDGRDMLVDAHSAHPVDETLLPDKAFVFNPKHTVKGITPKVQDQLLEMDTLTIPRVMKATGVTNPVEAQKMLLEMEKAGQVTHDGAGRFKVEESHVPQFDDPKELGHLVYYGTSADGAGKIGVIRGRDPTNPNKYLIEVGVDESLTPQVGEDVRAPRMGPHTKEQYAKAEKLGVKPEDVYPRTVIKKIDSQEVRTLKPVLMGDASASTLPQQMGVQTPLPPEVVLTNQAVVNEIATYTRKAGQLSKLLNTTQSIKQGLMNFISHESHYVPTDIRQKSYQLGAAPKQVKPQAEAYQKFLAKKLGGEMSTQDTLLSQAVERNAARRKGKLSQQEVELKKFFDANPELQGEAEKSIRLGVERMKQGSQELAALGMGDIANIEAARAAGVEDEYIQNVYMKYMLQRKDWAKFVKNQLPDVWDDAVAAISARHPKEHSQQIEKRMLDLLDMDVDAAYKQMRTSPNADVAKQLKHRVEMKQEIEKVLGKLDSASIRMAHSIASQDSLIRRIKLWNEVQATPYWSPGPRTDLGPHMGARVPDLPIYGNARNGYVHESMKYLVESKAPQEEGRQMLRAISSYWKFNVVPAGGLAPWVNNVMRNWKGMILGGGLLSPTDFATFFDAAEIMAQYKKNPILMGQNSLLTEAMNNGAVGTGLAGNEISKNRMANKVLEVVKRQKGSASDVWGILGAVPKTLKGAGHEVGAAYDTIDRLFKFTNYLNVRRNALARGMSIDDAAALATVRTKQSFPDYDNISPIIDKMRKGSISGIAPFLSSKAEDMRINATLIKRLAEEPDLRWRVLGAAGVLAAGASLNREIRRANGIDDDRVARALDADKLSSQTFRSASFIGPEVDEQGRLIKFDVTPWEDALISMQHHPMDPLFASLLRNQITGYVGEGGLMGEQINQMSSAAVGVRPLTTTNAPQYRPGENGPLTFLSYLAQHGGIPQFPVRLLQNLEKGQPHDPKYDVQHEQWTPGEMLAKSLGLPIAGPVGERTEVGRVKELSKSMHDISRQIAPSLLKNDEAHGQFLLQQKIDALNQLIQEYQQHHGSSKE